MVGVNLFIVAEELDIMIQAEQKKVIDSDIYRETLIGQALHGMRLSMQNVLAQAKLVTKIEREHPE